MESLPTLSEEVSGGFAGAIEAVAAFAAALWEFVLACEDVSVEMSAAFREMYGADCALKKAGPLPA